MASVLVAALFAAVTAVAAGTSRDGPSYLPAPRALRGVLSAHNDRIVNYRRDAAPSPHLSNPQELILGGRNAVLGEFPFIVTLQVKGGTSYEHICGGSIISHHTVLTAAHCVAAHAASELKVIAGKVNLEEKEDSQQERHVSRFIVHPNYIPYGASPNDVAVLFVEEPFTFNDFVRNVPLAYPVAKESEGFAVVSGWGDTRTWSANSPRPEEFNLSVMQTEKLPLMSHAECVVQAKKEIKMLITESMLCTGPLKAKYGPCDGDSGGPLVQNGVLIGIASWISGVRCGYESVSGFTRVSSFAEWILEADARIKHHNSAVEHIEL